MYSIKEASGLIGVSIPTLRRWEKEGKITSQRTRGGHRRYTLEMLSGVKEVKFEEKITVAYCRVSSGKKEELTKQMESVTNYCIAKGYSFKIIEDVASGLNYNRKGLMELLQMLQSNQVERVILYYKDRLVRFGYELIEQVCRYHNVKIEIINYTEDKVYENELVEDIMAVISSFSSRMYGSRTHKQLSILKESRKLFDDLSAQLNGESTSNIL